MSSYYTVRPCDEDDGRRTWDVVRVTVAGRSRRSEVVIRQQIGTRAVARSEARRLNAEAAEGFDPERRVIVWPHEMGGAL